MQQKLIIDQEFLNMTVPITTEQHSKLKKAYWQEDAAMQYKYGMELLLTDIKGMESV